MGGALVQIAPGIHVLKQTLGGRVHAAIVEHGDRLILVDTLFSDDAKVILDYLHKKLHRSASDISHLVLTHAHKSHLGGLFKLETLSGAGVYAHEWEVPIIEGKRKATPVGYDWPKPFNLEVAALQVALNKGIGKHTPVKVDGLLKEGQKIGPLEVIEVPGHTPGCVAFYHPEKRFLIAGDTVATWPQLDPGWPGFNLNHRQALDSVRKMAELPAVTVCVGHGEPILNDGQDVLKVLSNPPTR